MLKTLKILLSPATIVYFFIVRVRNYLFDKGIFKAKKVNAEIISIGNITVGGSGKTPAVIYTAQVLKNAGKKAGILSRGYRRKSKGYMLVSDGINLKTTVDECGDEMYLLSMECKLPAAVAERRVSGANKLIRDSGVEVIILDDAYQHRWIHRDLDILMFDQRFLNKVGELEQSLLPLGIMREPFSSIERADIIILNRKFSDEKVIPDKRADYFAGKKVFYAYYQATGIIDVKNDQFFHVEEFQGQKSLVVCGIARPHSFLKVLEQNTIDIKNKLLFPDHRDYTQKDIQIIRKKFYDTNANSVLTTQKDAVKLFKYSKELDDIDIYYLKIDLKIENNIEFNKELLAILN